MLINKKRKTAILGCGMEGSALYYRMRMAKVFPDFFVDNYRTELFWGHHVNTLSDILSQDETPFYYISSEKYYPELKKQLLAHGLREFYDFCKGAAFNKKLVYINANCYAFMLQEGLNSVAEFNEKYYIYYATPFYLEPDEFSNDEYLKNCDVYIHQDVRRENPIGEKFSDEYTRKRISNKCKEIVVPNLVGMGKLYFQQAYYMEDDKNKEAGSMFGVFPQGDKALDELYKEIGDVTETIEKWNSTSFFTPEEILNTANEVIKKYKKREENWDVRIVDYIEENYKTRRMFYDLYHPSNEVYEVIVRGILSELGIEDRGIAFDKSQNEYELPIYPEVAETLGLTFWEKEATIRRGSVFKFINNMDSKEWAREYLCWCYVRHNK